MLRANSWKKSTEALDKSEIYTGHFHFIFMAALAISFSWCTDSQSLIETHELKSPSGQKRRMNLSIPSSILQRFSQHQKEQCHMFDFGDVPPGLASLTST